MSMEDIRGLKDLCGVLCSMMMGRYST